MQTLGEGIGENEWKLRYLIFCIKGKFSFQRTLEIKNARWKRA